jgi:hypothetical protein
MAGEETILTSKQLLKCHQDRQNFTLPTFGDKINEQTNSWLEGKTVSSRLRSLHEVLAAPRVSQRSQLSEAEWKVEKSEVKK